MSRQHPQLGAYPIEWTSADPRKAWRMTNVEKWKFATPNYYHDGIWNRFEASKPYATTQMRTESMQPQYY